LVRIVEGEALKRAPRFRYILGVSRYMEGGGYQMVSIDGGGALYYC
jgi:hypothetical protein